MSGQDAAISSGLAPSRRGLAVIAAGARLFRSACRRSEADRQRNMLLLQERSWFNVPLVYKNKRRGILPS